MINQLKYQPMLEYVIKLNVNIVVYLAATISMSG
jgi:hypothetical protein